MIKLLPTIKLFQVVLTATGDLLVFLVAAVVVQLGVRIVQDGPALRVLHRITVTLVMHLAAPVGQKVKESKFWNRLDKVVFFCMSCGVWSRVTESWPVQIIHGCAGASFSTVAAVVGIVENRPAIRHHTQDHFSELVEGQVVQGLGWSATGRHNQKCMYTLLDNAWTVYPTTMNTEERLWSNCTHQQRGLQPKETQFGGCSSLVLSQSILSLYHQTLFI